MVRIESAEGGAIMAFLAPPAAMVPRVEWVTARPVGLCGAPGCADGLIRTGRHWLIRMGLTMSADRTRTLTTTSTATTA
jgi:hypothetical protein